MEPCSHKKARTNQGGEDNSETGSPSDGCAIVVGEGVTVIVKALCVRGNDIRIPRSYLGCQSVAGHEATRIHANESRSEISDGQGWINAPAVGCALGGPAVPPNRGTMGCA